MSGFRFVLAPLLDKCMREETERGLSLAIAVRDAAGERARAAEAHAAFARAGSAFVAAASSLTPAALRGAVARLALLTQAVTVVQARVQRSDDCESLARDAYAVARAERRRIEMLRDRAYRAFAYKAERRETLAIEEANEARHNSATFVAPSLHN